MNQKKVTPGLIQISGLAGPELALEPDSALEYFHNDTGRLPDTGEILVRAEGSTDIPAFQVSLAVPPPMPALSLGCSANNCTVRSTSQVSLRGQGFVQMTIGQSSVNCRFTDGGTIPREALELMPNGAADFFYGVNRSTSVDAGTYDVFFGMTRVELESVPFSR